MPHRLQTDKESRNHPNLKTGIIKIKEPQKFLSGTDKANANEQRQEQIQVDPLITRIIHLD